MGSEDIRWEQRFDNFQKALKKLSEVVEDEELKDMTELEVEGLIQRFEYTYELAWNTLQDLFKHQGYNDVAGPGPVIEQAFKNELISDAEGWARLRKSRQLTSHTYNKETANEIAKEVIEIYFSLFNQLRSKLLSLKDK